MPNDATLDACDPYRRPAWRWDRARAIRQGELDRRHYTDPVILVAADFPDGLRDDSEHTLIEAARELHQVDDPRRWEIEARLLAGESDDEIARETGAGAGVVHWYEQLFFNVRDCLGKRDYLMANVVRVGWAEAFRDGQLREFWLWQAVNAGAVVLDDLLAQWRGSCRSRGPARLSDYFRRRSAVPLEMQAFVAGNTIPLDEDTAAFFVDLETRLLKCRAVEGNTHDPAPLQREVVKAARRVVAGKPLLARRVRRRTVPAIFDPGVVEAHGKVLGALRRRDRPARTSQRTDVPVRA